MLKIYQLIFTELEIPMELNAHGHLEPLNQVPDLRHPITSDGNLIAFLRCTFQRFINRKSGAQYAENWQTNEIKKL